MKKKLMLMCAALLPLASCGLLDDGKDNTPSEGDNFVTVSVSDVRDGYFKLNFECGEGTQTIEYAVCRAVNMKTDSVAFKAGELDGVQRIELLDSATAATVVYDCSEPLDFGPYTVYARAVSSTGEVSAPAKAQVCALTTGVTVEYLSRALIRLKTSQYGDDYVCTCGMITQGDINEVYGGSFDTFMEEATGSAAGYINVDYRTPDGSDMERIVIPEELIGGFFVYGDLYAYFTTTDGVEITGCYMFEVPRPEVDSSVPLPGELSITEFEPVTEQWEDGGITYSMRAEITIGSNTECYALIYTVPDVFDWPEQFREEYPEYYAGLSDEEILKSIIVGDGIYYMGSRFGNFSFEGGVTGLFVGSDSDDGFSTFGETMVYLACPINSNFESGKLLIKEIQVPSKEEFPDPVPGESSAPGLMTRSGLAGQSGAAQHMEHSGPFVEFI